jgi:6-phospho-3-hexuloisomerase
LSDGAADTLIEVITAAKKIVLYGCGREGLQLRGFATRLFRLGREVSRHDDAGYRAGRLADCVGGGRQFSDRTCAGGHRS